jgi:hypothetical protein
MHFGLHEKKDTKLIEEILYLLICRGTLVSFLLLKTYISMLNH